MGLVVVIGIVFPPTSFPPDLSGYAALDNKYVLGGQTVAYFVHIFFLFSIYPLFSYLVKICHLSISYTCANSVLTA